MKFINGLQYVGEIPDHIESNPPTVEDFEYALTMHFETVAKSKRYDNRLSCALRAGYDGPFRAEGTAFATWMDTCNAMGYQFLYEVQAGQRALPDSTKALIDAMPPMIWP